MEKSQFIKAEEIAEILEISVPHAYRLIQQMNKELKEHGYITIAGKVSRSYFEKKCCFFSKMAEFSEQNTVSA